VAGNLLCSPSTFCLDTLFTSSDKKISGFTRPHVIGFVADLFFPLWLRPHVIGFVADIFFSTLESGFIFFRIRCRIRRIRVDGSRIPKEKLRIRKYPATCGRGLRGKRILELPKGNIITHELNFMALHSS